MKENSSHPKLLQHVAWLRLLDSPYQAGASLSLSLPPSPLALTPARPQNVGHAIHLLVKAAELDPNDAQTWYILGRCQVPRLRRAMSFQFIN